MSDTIARPAETARTLPRILPPMAMLAELTHRCPLACPYCSNPIALTQAKEELSTEEWTGVFAQAADLGVLHLHLSGGEPAARRDLVELTQAASSLGLYTNLITSGVGLTEARMNSLADAGLDHIQLSIQGVSPKAPIGSAGTKAVMNGKWRLQAGRPMPLYR